MGTKIEYEYNIRRKEDGYLIKSRDVNIIDSGVWVNDDLETNSTGCSIFIPFTNILQINRYELISECVSNKKGG